MNNKELEQQVLSIVKDIEKGYKTEHCPDCGNAIVWACDEYSKECECGADINNIISGFEYISDLLDINYTVDRSGNYKGARLLVAFGGPNIWIDTYNKTVEGYWWSDSYTASYYEDAMSLDDACEELYNCTI